MSGADGERLSAMDDLFDSVYTIPLGASLGTAPLLHTHDDDDDDLFILEHAGAVRVVVGRRLALCSLLDKLELDRALLERLRTEGVLHRVHEAAMADPVTAERMNALGWARHFPLQPVPDDPRCFILRWLACIGCVVFGVWSFVMFV
jgi:hypothetical protein